MICGCGGAGIKSGYHQRGDGVWTHVTCDQPTKEYLEVFLKTQPVLTHLNLLQGGPLHNTLLSNSELIDRVAIGVREDGEHILKHIDQYRWTPETIVGSETGRTARIWVHPDETGGDA